MCILATAPRIASAAVVLARRYGLVSRHARQRGVSRQPPLATAKRGDRALMMFVVRQHECYRSACVEQDRRRADDPSRW